MPNSYESLFVMINNIVNEERDMEIDLDELMEIEYQNDLQDREEDYLELIFEAQE